jgi:biotin carboxylase
MASDRRPVLGIVHSEQSVSAMKLSESASAVCDVVWIINTDEVQDTTLPRLLRKLGTTVDVAGMSESDAADALGPVHLDGIVAYSEPHIPATSALAGRLGLAYHDSVVTARLVDKFLQREALRAGGLPVPRFLGVPPRLASEDVDALVAQVEFPVVLKPRHGAGSRNTMRVGDAEQLRELLAEEQPPTSPGSTMVVEEYMVGAPVPPPFADYLSVESVVAGGRVSHVAVTGRLPPAEPFRETGLFIPSVLGPEETNEVLDVASAAIAALGIQIGFLHIEIKLTASGPRVIEVNGRLGGGVPDLMAVAAPGVDLFELSQRVALGEVIAFDDLVPTEVVGYSLIPQPPTWARRVEKVEGLDRLADYPGVLSIFLNRQPGDDVDWRKGNNEHVFLVLGAAPDHAGVVAVQQFIDEEVTVTYC